MRCEGSGKQASPTEQTVVTPVVTGNEGPVHLPKGPALIYAHSDGLAYSVIDRQTWDNHFSTMDRRELSLMRALLAHVVQEAGRG